MPELEALINGSTLVLIEVFRLQQYQSSLLTLSSKMQRLRYTPVVIETIAEAVSIAVLSLSRGWRAATILGGGSVRSLLLGSDEAVDLVLLLPVQVVRVTA